MSNKLKLAVLIYIVGLVYSIYYNMTGGSYLWMVPVSIVVPFIFPLLFRLIRVQLTQRIICFNLYFCLFAAIIGSTLGGYTLPYYDKIIHFISGILISLAGYVFYCVLKKQRRIESKEDIHVMYIFIHIFNLAIATLWEFFEYGMLIFFNNDCINHYTTGVHDAMSDMLCAFVAGSLVSMGIYFSYKNNKENALTRIYEEVYDKKI